MRWVLWWTCVWAVLAGGPAWGQGAPAGERPAFSHDEAVALIEELGELLETQHSYSAARGVDVEDIVRRETALIGEDGYDHGRMLRALERLIAPSGDGHGRVGGTLGARGDDPLPGGGLPFAVLPLEPRSGGRVLAVEDNGERLLDPTHPYLVAIDGVQIERWLEIAAEIVPDGSAQAQRFGACRGMRDTAWIHERLGLTLGRSSVVTLESPEGTKRERRVLTAPARPREYRHSADRTTGHPGEGIAYVPIPAMYDADDRRERREFVEVGRALLRAQGARALIIDIRGNTGGTRDVLHLVASFLMGESDAPIVYSAARVLRWEGRDDDEVREQLAARRLYPVTSDRWSEAERAAIDEFLARFEPEVSLDEERFGELHVSLLTPGGPGEGRLADKPVVVLMDEGCVSASDVFLAAVRELSGVTLAGRPSRGASGLAIRHTLNPDARVTLSSMVSFMPSGRVFDWHGVEPDVGVALTPEDFTRHGTDTAMRVANELLQENPND